MKNRSPSTSPAEIFQSRQGKITRPAPEPSQPSEVSLSQRQLLEKVIPKGKPLVAEAVVLGPQVQDLNQALLAVNLDGEPDHDRGTGPGDEESPPLRRSARLDYKKLNNTGAKQRKVENVGKVAGGPTI